MIDPALLVRIEVRNLQSPILTSGQLFQLIKNFFISMKVVSFFEHWNSAKKSGRSVSFTTGPFAVPFFAELEFPTFEQNGKLSFFDSNSRFSPNFGSLGLQDGKVQGPPPPCRDGGVL